MSFKTRLTFALLALTYTTIEGQTNSPTQNPNSRNNNNIGGAGNNNKPTNRPTNSPFGAPATQSPFGNPGTQSPFAPGTQSPFAPGTNRPQGNQPATAFPTRRPLTPTPRGPPPAGGPAPATPGGAPFPGPSVSNTVDDSCGCGPPVTINQYCGSCEGKVNIVSRDFTSSFDGASSSSSSSFGPQPQNLVKGNCDCAEMTQRIHVLEEEMKTLKLQTRELIVLLNNKSVHNYNPNRDCDDLYFKESARADRIYEINPTGQNEFPVYCMFERNSQGAVTNKWTMLMNRVNGDTSFDRTWAEYSHGFGALGPNTNFMLGLEKWHQLTSQKRQYIMRIDIVDWDGERRYAEYDYFKIGSATEGYPISYGKYSGDAGDSLGDYHRDMKFTTKDIDNDLAPDENCAHIHGGGFWYKDCDHANFNGPFRPRSEANLVLNDENVDYGLEWDAWKQIYSFAGVMIRLRPTFDDNF